MSISVPMTATGTALLPEAPASALVNASHQLTALDQVVRVEAGAAPITLTLAALADVPEGFQLWIRMDQAPVLVTVLDPPHSNDYINGSYFQFHLTQPGKLYHLIACKSHNFWMLDDTDGVDPIAP